MRTLFMFRFIMTVTTSRERYDFDFAVREYDLSDASRQAKYFARENYEDFTDCRLRLKSVDEV